ncbi:hypothetical protein Csa_015433 [Cucumis sativus]|nr:hypothetical protein Csa_015433 [Cucumis sativus]
MACTNLKLNYRSIVDIVFHACGKTYNVVDLEQQMRLLESNALGIREELQSIGFSRWSRAYSPLSRYNVMTTNISENLNNAIIKARELSICSMFELWPLHSYVFQMSSFIHSRMNTSSSLLSADSTSGSSSIS